MENKARISGMELRRDLNLLILAVTFGMAFMVVVSGAPLTGFTRALGAGDFVYGVIMAMPVIGGVVQVFASYYLETTGKRKLSFLIFGIFHRFLWIPIALVPVFIPPSQGVARIWAVTVLITLSSIASSIITVSFYSWIGVLVPMEIRGRFFSKRTMISTISAAVTGLLVGKFLDLIPGFNGYTIAFIAVSLLGIADMLCFIWIKDPPMDIPKEKVPFFKLFFEPYGNKNYIRFIIYVALWNFGVNIVGPFFNVYMLEHLNMTFFTMSLFGQVISNISTIVFIRFWGKLVDRYGNKPVMAICCACVASLPLLWCFATPQNYYIILVINFLAGIFWPGYDMTAINLSIWLAPQKNRSIYIANYMLITSLVGIAAAYICGGAFMQLTKPLFSELNLPFILNQKFSSFHALFILASVLRFTALIFFQPRINEENAKSPYNILSNIFKSLRVKSDIYTGQ